MFILLVVVCENKYLDVVLELVKVGVDVNKYIKYVLIIVVSKSGKLDIVCLLLKCGVNVN